MFLDDDVVPTGTWLSDLTADLAGLGPDVGASQGRITVPLPPVATDWERNVGGLERARWATADMAYRRAAAANARGRAKGSTVGVAAFAIFSVSDP